MVAAETGLLVNSFTQFILQEVGMGRANRTSFKLAIAGLLLVLPVALLMGCSDDDKSKSNSPPTIASVTVSPNSVSPGGSCIITVLATDPDGDALTYTYGISGGTTTGAGASVTWTLPSTPGAYSVLVTVSDGSLTASQQAGVTVTQPQTQVTGTLTLVPGDPGDVRNSQVALYATLADWANYAPFIFVGAQGATASSASYTIGPIPAGTYYIDAWRDNDSDGFWSVADLVGWYGSGAYGSPTLTPFSIVEGQTKVINMQMLTIP